MFESTLKGKFILRVLLTPRKFSIIMVKTHTAYIRENQQMHQLLFNF
jgi:hypothetical protein